MVDIQDQPKPPPMISFKKVVEQRPVTIQVAEVVLEDYEVVRAVEQYVLRMYAHQIDVDPPGTYKIEMLEGAVAWKSSEWIVRVTHG